MPAGYPSQVQVNAELSVPSTSATSGDKPLMGYSNNFDIDWVLSLKSDRSITEGKILQYAGPCSQDMI
ncbi:hypothetical protein CGGC5_v000460 [Colletotrichum fructicola Nara gc5]|uniref:Uncharacterized protein n=1 Tax=Colletotrichum fructicola (strain Nara gc5) TaxID=1213859 RepID=A0A7J6JRN3_COLFN|nr:hypothetical protein CGGC5_v000460 [Colletotrichum fructicola Nara gc5]